MDYKTSKMRVKRSPDIELAVTVAGAGPLLLLVHGFPESWYSWRHQIDVLAAAGYRVAALHVRGYGHSSKPCEIAAYALTELAGDIAEVIRALDPTGAVLIGHDWGAMMVQTVAILHPDLVKGVAVLSVPAVGHPRDLPSSQWSVRYPDRLFYQAYFQTPGIAEAEFEPDMEKFICLFFFGLSGEGDPYDSPLIRPGKVQGLLDGLANPSQLPAWLSQADVEHYVASFRAGGLTGPLNRYRCADLDWHQLQPFADRMIVQPGLFIAGTRDPVRYLIPGFDRYASPVSRMSDVRGVHLIEGAGHWVQQEAPEATNRLLLDFLAGLFS